MVANNAIKLLFKIGSYGDVIKLTAKTLKRH